MSKASDAKKRLKPNKPTRSYKKIRSLWFLLVKVGRRSLLTLARKDINIITPKVLASLIVQDINVTPRNLNLQHLTGRVEHGKLADPRGQRNEML